MTPAAIALQVRPLAAFVCVSLGFVLGVLVICGLGWATTFYSHERNTCPDCFCLTKHAEAK